jgi:actin-related protein 2
MIGDEAAPLRSFLEIKYPLKEGKILNWEDMELLWTYCFDEKLKIKDCNSKSILLTEPALNPTKNREKMGEIMFEKYNFGGVAFEVQALLTLMAEGNTTGAVMDSGDGVSHVIPVYEGMIQSDNIKRLNIAGRHVTEYLIKLLMLRGYSFNGSADYELVREIKEDLCYTSINIKKERAMAKDTTVLDKEYKLPDGTTIMVGRERFEAPEILMNPGLLELEDDGMAEMVYNSICGCPLDIQKPLA